MRVFITNDKNKIASFLYDYMNTLLVGKKVEMILNGNKIIGEIHSVELSDTETTWFEISINDSIKKIPITDETKARLGKEILYFETKTHTTVIEFIH
jgi:hypothetical protein